MFASLQLSIFGKYHGVVKKICTLPEDYVTFFLYHTFFCRSRQDCKNAAAFAAAIVSFLAEGFAVSALIDSGVGFVGAHQDLIQRAEVLGVAVVGALLDGAFDGLVGIAVHIGSSFCFDTQIV